MKIKCGNIHKVHRRELVHGTRCLLNIDVHKSSGRDLSDKS